jgi:hypothetical protein
MNVFSMRASLEIAVSEAKFFEEFFVRLDFFFVTFFCIKTKESKANHESSSWISIASLTYMVKT